MFGEVVLKKFFTSAIVLIPPQQLWPPIQEIRKNYDRAYFRWYEKLNLLISLFIFEIVLIKFFVGFFAFRMPHINMYFLYSSSAVLDPILIGPHKPCVL
jgi:hypothetical protein